MHSHHYMRRLPDWTAAAVSGLAAGALLIVVEMFWSTMVPAFTHGAPRA
jgi:hypothetical protein